MSDRFPASGNGSAAAPGGGPLARTARRPRADARVVAVTGACTFLGTELIKRLEEDERYARILAIDVRRPDIPFDKTHFYNVDLTVPTVGEDLSRIFRDEAVDTVVHAAFLSFPTHAGAWAHELEDIGTMHLLNACAEVPPARLLLLSTTLVYGASPANPNYLIESQQLRGAGRARYLGDRVRAEKQVARFADENPATQVAVLRFAPCLGPTISNLFTRFFSRPLAPVLMGHDPLVQLLHEADAAWALKLAVDRDAVGPFNIVGKGVLPYTTVLALMGKVPVPVPHFAARPLSRALWATQLSSSPPSFLNFLRFMCVADGHRAEEELGFIPRFTLTRTIIDFLGVTRDDGAPDITRAQG